VSTKFFVEGDGGEWQEQQVGFKILFRWSRRVAVGASARYRSLRYGGMSRAALTPFRLATKGGTRYEATDFRP